MPSHKRVSSTGRSKRKANHDGISAVLATYQSGKKSSINTDLLSIFSQCADSSASILPNSDLNHASEKSAQTTFIRGVEGYPVTQALSEFSFEDNMKNASAAEEGDQQVLRKEGEDDLWQALPAVVESDCDEEDTSYELPCSTESCVVEVPQADLCQEVYGYVESNATDAEPGTTSPKQVESVLTSKPDDVIHESNDINFTDLKWDPDAAFLEIDQLVEKFHTSYFEQNITSQSSPVLSLRESRCSDSGLSSSPEVPKPEADVTSTKGISRDFSENLYSSIEECDVESKQTSNKTSANVPQEIEHLGPLVVVQTVEDVDEGRPQQRIRFELGATSSLPQPYESNNSYQNPVILNASSLLESARHKWTQSLDSLRDSVSVLQKETALLTQPLWQHVNHVTSNVSHSFHRVIRQVQLRYISTTRDTAWLPRLDLPGIIRGQHGFEELRKHVKVGGDFCKELASILQERSELEANYAKGLSKLGAKLAKITRELDGSIHAAWHSVGAETEAEAEFHKALSVALAEELVKPLRITVDTQHRVRKSVEATVDKSGRALSDWRQAQMKAKKQNYVCARDNEKIQDQIFTEARLGRPRPMTDKESAKLDSKRRKTEDAMKKADIEYYSCCVRGEQARLEWESATSKGSHCFQTLEEERLTCLKELVTKYHSHIREMGPKLIQSAERLCTPVSSSNVSDDLHLVHALKDSGPNVGELLLPDFYAEHMSNVMNRERRKQCLERCLHLVRADLERETRGKRGLENLSRALSQSPQFGNEETQQDVVEKLSHLKAMLAFLEATRFKVQNAIAEMDAKPKTSHPLARYMEVHKDKQGLVQTLLKLPAWLDDHEVEPEPDFDDERPAWTDRGMADGTSAQPDSDFDEFSSQDSDCDYTSITETVVAKDYALKVAPSVGRCKALYTYSAKLYDELTIEPGDIINVHDKQPDGWWLGELGGTVGIFPATYVEELDL